MALLQFWGREREPPDPGTLVVKSLLLASEGRAIVPEAIDLAATIARKSGADVRVISIARVWGAAFGLPNPSLMPNKREWEEQRSLVADAVKSLQRRDIKAAGTVVARATPRGKSSPRQRGMAVAPSSWRPMGPAIGWSPTCYGRTSLTGSAAWPEFLSIW